MNILPTNEPQQPQTVDLWEDNGLEDEPGAAGTKPTQREAPGEYIGHAVRLDKLSMKLLTEAQAILDGFNLALKFEPSPGEIRVILASDATQIDADQDTAIENVISIYASENEKCFLHYLDYLAIVRRNNKKIERNEENLKAEIASLKANNDLEQAKLRHGAEGFDYCYGYNFREMAEQIVLKNKKPDGTFKSGGKTIRTLFGSFGYQAKKDVFNGKYVELVDAKALQAYLHGLRDSAARLVEESEEDPLEQWEKEEAQAAHDILVALPISFETVTENVLNCKPGDLKPLAEKYKIPGFTFTKIDERAEQLGEFFIK